MSEHDDCPDHFVGAETLRCDTCGYDAAYEQYLLDEAERICPTFAQMHDGYADPITVAYGASDVITDSIIAHVRSCEHPFCVDERQS